MKRILAAVLVCCLVLAGCGGPKAAVEEKLVKAFIMESDEAVDLLELADQKPEHTDWGSIYHAQYNWCGKQMDTELLFSGRPTEFTATATYPANTDTWTFITESAALFSQQFGNPYSSTYYPFDKFSEQSGMLELYRHVMYTEETSEKVFMEFWTDREIQCMFLHYHFSVADSDWEDTQGRYDIWVRYDKDAVNFENIKVTFTLYYDDLSTD